MRNAFFEPSIKPKMDWIDEVLKRAEIAFKWKAPLIIGSHRLNFIGGLDLKNRDRNLQNLKKLLVSLISRWPDIKFTTSDKLYEIILASKK